MKDDINYQWDLSKEVEPKKPQGWYFIPMLALMFFCLLLGLVII